MLWECPRLGACLAAVLPSGSRTKVQARASTACCCEQCAATQTTCTAHPAAASPRPAVAANTMVTAIGWGYVDSRQTTPKVLMEVRVQTELLD